MTIEELKQALEAATPGPLTVEYYDDFEDRIKVTCEARKGKVAVAEIALGFKDSFDAEQKANARLIVEAVNNLPALLKLAEERDALQARCDKLEDAASTLLAHLVAAVSVIKTSEENGNHPSCAYGSDTMYRMAIKDFHKCMEAGRDALRSVVDGGE